MNIDDFLFDSDENCIDMTIGVPEKSDYFDEFLRLMDNEYLINNVLQSEFKFFCESRLEKIEIDGEEITTRQKLLYTDYFSGVLTKIPEEKHSFIKETWQMIWDFLNNSSKADSIYTSIKKITKKLMIFSPPLRTEMILQLIKLSNNDIIEEKVKIWQLFSIICNYVMIEKNFFYYFLNFIYNSYNSPTNEITVRGYASFCFVNVIKNRALDDRSVVPTVNQIRSIFQVLKLDLNVYLDDQNFIKMRIEVFDTVEHIKQKIFKYFKWKEDLMPFITFLEFKDNDKHFDENYVEDFVRVADILASWELSYANRNFMPFGDEVADDTYDDCYKLYLRCKYFHPEPPLQSIESVENSLHVCELVRSLRIQRIKMNIEDLTKAIALYCSLSLPEMNVKNMVKSVSKIKKLARYLIPDNKNLINRVLFGEDPEVSEEDGMKDAFSEILDIAKDFDIERKKKEFCDCFYKNPCHKAQYYKIKFDSVYVLTMNYPSTGCFYISPDKLGIVDINQSHLIRLKYEDIKTISVYKRKIVLVINRNIEDIDDNDKNQKMVFESNQADNIYKAFQSYVSLKLNGYYKQPEIKFEKVYEDDEDQVLDFQLLDHLLDPTFALENTNRHYKIIPSKPPKVEV